MHDTRRRELWERHAPALGVAALASVAALGGSLLAVGPRPSFVVAAAAAVLLELLPDVLVTRGIDTLRDIAQPLLVLSATALLVTLGTGVLFAVDRGLDRATDGDAGAAVRAVATLLAVLVLTYLLTGSAASAFGGALAAALAVLVAVGVADPADTNRSRRRLLRAGAVAVGTVGLGALFQRGGGSSVGDAVTETPDPAAQSLLDDADALGFDLPDAEPMISENFYQVDIATANPDLATDEWSLTVTGLVEEERTFTLSELREEFPAERRFVTLRCVSDRINGTKMDNALWTGLPVSALLDEVGAPESCCVTLHGADDYYVSFPREALDPGLLAYGMNGRTLPRGHGYPLRTLVPGHWGETNAKWLTEIEIREEPENGYWESRGWQGTGEVHTVAKLHSTRRDGETVRVGGHAYAGTRGISAVEVSTDGGETWTEAELSEPLPGPTPVDGDDPQPEGEATDAWRMWQHEYEQSGNHEVVVRAVDGTGTVQPRTEQESFPEGATGWVRETVGA